jgi:hypothetical protein
MLMKKFNRAWETERDIIEKQLSDRLTAAIKDIDHSLRVNRHTMSKEDLAHIGSLRNDLVLRRSLAIYESEEIARNRMQLRSSYMALFMSSVALIISAASVIF